MGNWLVTLWNHVVQVAPTVLHTVCDLIKSVADKLTIPPGTPPVA